MTAMITPLILHAMQNRLADQRHRDSQRMRELDEILRTEPVQAELDEEPVAEELEVKPVSVQDRVRAMKLNGMHSVDIARALEIPESTVRGHIRKLGLAKSWRKPIVQATHR